MGPFVSIGVKPSGVTDDTETWVYPWLLRLS